MYMYSNKVVVQSTLKQGANRLFKEFSRDFSTTLIKLTISEGTNGMLTDIKEAFLDIR